MRYTSKHHALLISARAHTSLAYTISVDPLSFYYGCQTWEDYRPLLHFLALVRLRIQNDTFVLAPAGLPLRLQLVHMPAELTHEIFAYVFASLIEDRKLAMLDAIGPCSHGGFYPSRDPEMSDNEWVERNRADKHKLRRKLLADGKPGVCLVDQVGLAHCYPRFRRPDCPPRAEDDDDWGEEELVKTCRKMRRVWDAESPKLSDIVRTFGLALLNHSGLTYDPELKDENPFSDNYDYPSNDVNDLLFVPALIGVPLSGSSFDITTSITAGRHFGHQPQGVSSARFRQPRALEPEENERFETIVRLLRLGRPHLSARDAEEEKEKGEAEGREWCTPVLTVLTRLEGAVEELEER